MAELEKERRLQVTNIQLFNPLQKSIEECIALAYASFNVPPLGGASEDGWSKMSDFQRCPYRYYKNHVEEKNPALVQIAEKPVNLELGALFHACLACHYIGSIKRKYIQFEKREYVEYPTALELLNRVLALGGNPDIVAEVERLYLAYFNHYGNPHNEGIQPLAIELPAGKPGVHTCRFDMLSYHGGNTNGVWIDEHKTASRETRDVLEGWWLDGEIIGEVYGYKLSGLEKVYGPLIGVSVNVVIKTKEPKFRRVEVVVPDSLLERYIDDREYWGSVRADLTARSKTYGSTSFPRKLQGCIGRYGTCELWDHCRDADATDSGRLMSLLQASIDKGGQ